MVKLNKTSVSLLELFYSLTRSFLEKDKETYHLTNKRKGENEIEYGYYFNPGHVVPLLELLNKLKITQLIDFGSGVGILLKILAHIKNNLYVIGLENEKEFVKRALVQTHNRDIITLSKESLDTFIDEHERWNEKSKTVIYFWEPIFNEDKAKEFVDNLVKITRPNQIIIYNQSGGIGYHMRKSNAFKRSDELEYGVLIFIFVTLTCKFL